MNDLISRQAAIDTLMEILDRPNHAEFLYTDEICGALWNLPSAQQWIPCSERLPDAEDCPMDCMVTRRSKYVGNYTDMAVAEADGTWTHEN